MKAYSALFAFLLFPILSLGQASVSVSVAPKSTPPPKSASPLATVDGQAITEDDLLPQVEGPLRPLREQEYQIKKRALDSLITQRLMEAEAKKKGISTEKLYEQEVDAKVAEPTDVELKAIYEVQKDQNRPFEEMKPQLAQTLKRARIQQGRQEYSAHLREQAKVSLMLNPPRIEVAVDPARVRGNPKAKVMIVEFSDFQCPYCGQVEGTLKSVLAKHEGVVALAFRDYPLSQIHPMALGAAEAARCAGEQGKFWEYHDLLFGDQGNLDRNGLIAKAAKLQLDAKQFETCISSEKYKAAIQQDNQEGVRAGVSGTPGFFINGVFLNGAQPESTFEKTIQDQLALSPVPKS
jgi:protein-disulfide isomerase